jgi:hypothetical protein
VQPNGFDIGGSKSGIVFKCMGTVLKDESRRSCIIMVTFLPSVTQEFAWTLLNSILATMCRGDPDCV